MASSYGVVMQRFELDTPEGAVPATIEGGSRVGILLATGAGTDQEHPGVSGLRTRLAAAGTTVMSFDYAYRAAGRPFPDRPPKLLSVHRAAAAHLRDRVDQLVLAGRSMGGRMSTMLAAAGEPCSAVVVYGYPLHPAGKPEKLRVEHLVDIAVPTLMITGTRDALALPDLVDAYLRPLPTVTLELIKDADHSFRRKGSGSDEMLDLLADTTINWLRSRSELAESLGTPP